MRPERRRSDWSEEPPLLEPDSADTLRRALSTVLPMRAAIWFTLNQCITRSQAKEVKPAIIFIFLQQNYKYVPDGVDFLSDGTILSRIYKKKYACHTIIF
jgi:hypothetical protein